MTPTDAVSLAKDAVRIVATAGLSKDVIDLLEKKLALLTDELAQAQAKIAKLEAENEELKKKAAATQPVSGVDAEAAQVLLRLSQGGGELTCYQIADASGLSLERVKRHLGYLRKLGFAQWSRAQIDDYDPPNSITHEGSDFLYQQKMI